MAFPMAGPVGFADRVELVPTMRLTRKFIAALVIGVALVALVQGWFDYRRETEVFDSQLRAEAIALGRALAGGVQVVWSHDGEVVAIRYLEAATTHGERMRARWVWLDAQVGSHKPLVPASELEAMKHGDPVIIRDSANQRMITYIPVEAPIDPEKPGEPPKLGGVEIAQSLQHIDAFVRDSLRNEIIGSASEVAIAAALALGLGVVFIGRPISRLAAKARRVGTGDLSGPLQLGQHDELGELATEINLMCERLAEERGARESATEQLRHADRLTTVGKLASGLAHELGTPLNVVSGRARLIVEKEVEGAEAIDSARIVLEQSERMTALIRQLLDFARPRALETAPVNVSTLATRVCELVGTIARKANVKLVAPPIDDTLRIEADDGQMGQVLTNLVVNAVQAMPEGGGTVTITTHVVEHVAPSYVGSDAHDWMAIEVADTGHGMDEPTRQRIFEPFFTTKEVGEVTGLGLSVSWGIVREHGGWIDVASSQGKGSTFTVYLPRTGGAA